jgi:PAS domain S-box-containing protein
MTDPDNSKAKILIVDDVPENLHALIGILRDEFTVVAATDGKKALQIAQDISPPELILLDIRMPGMDGYQVLKRLKSNPKTEQIPVIFVTALNDEDNEAQGLDMGAVDYITKPANPAITLLRIQHQMALKNAQQKLHENEQMLRIITDAVQSAVFLIDDEDTIRFANPAVQTIFGYEQHELIGKKLHSIFIPDNTRIKARKGLEIFRKTGEGPVLANIQEMQAVHKNGTELTTLIHVGRIKRDGRWWSAGAAIDITELRAAQADLLKSQQEAIQAGRLASIGFLAAGIAHEINTPAQYIHNNLEFLGSSIETMSVVLRSAQRILQSPTDAEAIEAFKSCSTDEIDFLLEELPSAISQSQDGIAQITNIVQSMKVYAHPSKKEKQYEDLHQALESVITITHNAAKSVATITRRFTPDLPDIFCNISELRQVFINLIINAIQAIGEAHNETKKMGEIIITTELQNNNALISFADSGDGIPENIRDQIFDPFFTTKEVGQGSGQGLNICYDIIVNKHHGMIEARNSRDSGAIFTVRLPIKPGGNVSD